jgi:hypothetical protein
MLRSWCSTKGVEDCISCSVVSSMMANFWLEFDQIPTFTHAEGASIALGVLRLGKSEQESSYKTMSVPTKQD